MVFAIVLTLLLSAFFSGIEIAFISSSKIRIELDKNKGLSYGKIISEFMEEPGRFISTLLIGNNIALVIFGSLMANVLVQKNFGFLPEHEFPLLLIQTLITTVLVLLFGEFFPKTLFQIQPESILKYTAWPLKYLVYRGLQPLGAMFTGLSKLLITRILKLDWTPKENVFSAADLEHFIRETASRGPRDEEEESEINTAIFEKALYLKEVKVRECMVPRTEIQGIEINEPIEDLEKRFIESKLSRLIVYRESIDEIKGYVHHHALLKGGTDVRSLMMTIPVVPETMTARDLLYLFIRETRSIAWVVDEYGGTAGVVTLEDIIEEIFGEIQDEHDDENYIERLNPDGTYLFSGRLEVDYINEKYGFELPNGEYETLAGLIMAESEDLPDVGVRIELASSTIEIMLTSGNKIDLIRLIPKPENGSDN